MFDEISSRLLEFAGHYQTAHNIIYEDHVNDSQLNILKSRIGTSSSLPATAPSSLLSPSAALASESAIIDANLTTTTTPTYDSNKCYILSIQNCNVNPTDALLWEYIREGFDMINPFLADQIETPLVVDATGSRTIYLGQTKVSSNSVVPNSLPVLTIDELVTIARQMAAHDILLSILPEEILVTTKTLRYIIAWLGDISQLSDGICRLVTHSLNENVLRTLMANDGRMPTALTNDLHTLFLTLMADQSFKSSVALAYAQEIVDYSKGYARGFGTVDKSIYGISVQFLNRKNIVDVMQDQHLFLNKLGLSLSTMLDQALVQLRRNLTPKLDIVTGRSYYLLDHGDIEIERKSAILQQRRYNPLVGDLRVACSLDGIPYQFTQVSLKYWLHILGTFHNFHPQLRITTTHIGFESKIWMQAFNLSLALASLFDPLLSWISYYDHRDTIQITDIESTKKFFPSLFDVENEGKVRLSADVGYAEIREFDNEFTPTPVRLMLQIYSVIVTTELPPSPASRTSHEIFAGVRPNSFHPLLHRFLSSVIRSCCSHTFNSTSLNYFKAYLQHEITFAPHRGAELLDTALKQLKFAAEINCNLWRRNGLVMNDQILNYAEVPYCRHFRDLDLLLVQFCTATYGEPSVEHMFRRYGMINTIPEIPVGSSIDAMMTDLFVNGWIQEHGGKLKGDFLTLLILIISEVPIAPAHDEESLDARITILSRREFIHKLAAGPSTFSNLHDASLIIANNEQARSGLIDEVIEGVANWTQSSEVEAAQLTLKPECWSEYNPCFSHMSARQHESVVEARPKVTEPKPLVPPNLELHNTFANAVPTILRSLLLRRFLQMMLHVYAASCSEDKSRFDKLNPSIVCSSTDFAHVVQLLTQMTHDINKESVTSITEEFTDWLCCDFNVNVREVLSYMNIESEDEIESKTFDIKSPVESTMEIYKFLKTSNEDSNMMNWLYWIIQSIRRLSPKAQNKCDTEEDRLNLEKSKERKEDMKNKSQQRAMAFITQQNKAFMEQLSNEFADLSDSDDENEISGGKMESTREDGGSNISGNISSSLKRSSKSDASDDDEEDCLCIICHEKGDGMMGYLALTQYSRVKTLSNHNINGLHLNEIETADSTSDEKRTCHLQFCGHAMHINCFDPYFATTVHRSETQDDLILDTLGGEFQCPLCKRLGNLLVPCIPGSGHRKWKRPNPNLSQSEEDLQNMKQEDISWLQWPAEMLRISNTNENMNEENGTTRIDPNAMELENVQDDQDTKQIESVSTSSRGTRSSSSLPSVAPSSSSSSSATGVSRLSPTTQALSDTISGIFGLFSFGGGQASGSNSSGRSSRSTSISAGTEADTMQSYQGMIRTTADAAEAMDTGESSDSMAIDFAPPLPQSANEANMQALSGTTQQAIYLTKQEDEKKLMRVKQYWSRFLRDLSLPVRNSLNNHESHNNNLSLLSTVEYVDVVLSTLAYTCACDAAENHAGYHLLNLSKVDDLRLLDSVFVALNKTFSDLRIKDVISEFLMCLVDGRLLPNAIWATRLYRGNWPDKSDISEDLNEVNSLFTSSRNTFLNHNLLSRSLLDTFVLGLSLDQNESSSPDIMHLYQWMAIARLVQLVITAWTDSDDFADSISASCGSSSSPQINASDDTLITKFDDASFDTGPNISSPSLSLISFVNTVICKLIPNMIDDKNKFNATNLPTVLSSIMIQKIGTRWLDFVGSLAHILHRCRPGLIPVYGSSFCKEINIESDGVSLDNVQAQENLWCTRIASYGIDVDVTADRTRLGLETRIRRWIESLLCIPQTDMIGDIALKQDKELTPNLDNLDVLLKVSRLTNIKYTRQQAKLSASNVLPQSYTKLHGAVSSLIRRGDSTTEFPAICMACGLCLDASGKGLCTAHARKCCGDGGAFFLVQDCIVLLLHGPRASYFGPLYLDVHGERHRNHRGKPLNLNTKMVEHLRKLWASHGIPREVVLKRSTSTRVIINSHY